MGFENPSQAPSGPELGSGTERPKEEQRSPERTEALFKSERFLLHEKSVDILGVAHVPETIEQYQRELETSIQKSSVVMLEAAPNATGVYSQETATWYANFQKSVGIDITPADAARELKADPVFTFFGSMEALAAKHGKDIVVADPMSTSEQGIVNVYSRSMLEAKDDDMNKVKALAFGAGVLGMMAPRIVDTLTRARERPGEDDKAGRGTASGKKSEGSVSLMNRRNFLKLAGGAAAMAVVGTEGASALRKKGYGGRGENPLGAALYDSTDYRDVITAEGLERVTRSPSYGDAVTVICGDKHRAPIRHYAESPRERGVKEKAYAPYHDVATPRLRRFRYDSKRGWQQVNEEKL